VIRKSFLRSMRLRVLPSLMVEVRVSKGTSEREITRFLEENQIWIEAAHAKMQTYVATLPQYSFVEDQSFLYLGHEMKLKFWEENHSDLVGRNLMCPKNIQGDEKKIRDELRNFFKREAETILFLRAYKIAKDMGIEPKKIRLRDLKTRWGSCSHEGYVSLSWKLVACPLDVIDYVIVHEYCHLVHMNHSKNFWNLVEAHCPNWKVLRKWLRQNAMKLDFLEKKSQLYF
jgi:predicted metal-dependent hydrolase